MNLIQRLYSLMPRIKHLFQVGAVGLIGFVLQTLIFEILGIQLELMRPGDAVLLGGEIAILSNFFLNERFNFKERIEGSFIKRITTFHLVVFVSVAIQWVLVTSAEQFDPENTLLIRAAYLCGIGLGFITNYLGYSLVVWKKK